MEGNKHMGSSESLLDLASQITPYCSTRYGRMTDIFTIYQLALQKAMRLLDEEQMNEKNEGNGGKVTKPKNTKMTKKDDTKLKKALSKWVTAKDVSIVLVVLITVME